MLILKKFRSLLTLLLFLSASMSLLACEGDNGQLETVSLQKSILIDLDADFNQYIQKEMVTINTIAKDLNLENFKVTSRDFSVSRSTQMTDKFEAYFSVSLSFAPNEKAFSEFVQAMNITSASQYIYEDNCED